MKLTVADLQRSVADTESNSRQLHSNNMNTGDLTTQRLQQLPVTTTTRSITVPEMHHNNISSGSGFC